MYQDYNRNKKLSNQILWNRIDEVLPFYKNEEKRISTNEKNQLHGREQKNKYNKQSLQQNYK
jgi:hypothetical protein